MSFEQNRGEHIKKTADNIPGRALILMVKDEKGNVFRYCRGSLEELAILHMIAGEEVGASIREVFPPSRGGKI